MTGPEIKTMQAEERVDLEQDCAEDPSTQESRGCDGSHDGGCPPEERRKTKEDQFEAETGQPDCMPAHIRMPRFAGGFILCAIALFPYLYTMDIDPVIYMALLAMSAFFGALVLKPTTRVDAAFQGAFAAGTGHAAAYCAALIDPSGLSGYGFAASVAILLFIVTCLTAFLSTKRLEKVKEYAWQPYLLAFSIYCLFILILSLEF